LGYRYIAEKRNKKVRRNWIPSAFLILMTFKMNRRRLGGGCITYELLGHILSVVVVLYPYLKSLRI
jgi:hypothetical protein